MKSLNKCRCSPVLCRPTVKCGVTAANFSKLVSLRSSSHLQRDRCSSNCTAQTNILISQFLLDVMSNRVPDLTTSLSFWLKKVLLMELENYLYWFIIVSYSASDDLFYHSSHSVVKLGPHHKTTNHFPQRLQKIDKVVVKLKLRLCNDIVSTTTYHHPSSFS